MKDYLKMFAAAALTVLSAACVSEIEEIQSVDLKSRKVVASFEEETRTDVQGPVSGKSKVVWKAGDQIRYFRYEGDPGAVHDVAEDCSSTTIEMTKLSDEVEETYVAAIYGAEEGATPEEGASYKEGVFKFRCGVKEEQDGVFGTGHVSVALADAGATKLSFRNVTSMIKFSLTRKDVDYVIFSGNNGEVLHGGGEMEVSLDKDGIPVGAYPVNGDKGTIIKVTTNKKTGGFYISTLPVTLLRGFTITCYDADGNMLASSSTVKSLKIERDGIYFVGDAGGKYASIDLSRGFNGDEKEVETSNCYIVPATGKTYMFPATVKGNGTAVGDDKSVIEAPDFAYVVWENSVGNSPDGKGNLKLGGVVTDVIYNDGYVHFKAVGKGSALIAVMSGNSIVWSWHIWVWPGYGIRGNSHEYYGKFVDEHGKTNKRYQVLMDRDLGAAYMECTGSTDYRSWGYLYQWGRKDPFPGRARTISGAWASSESWPGDKVSSKETGTIEYAVAHPTTRIYGSSASRNDWVYEANRDDLWSVDFKTMYDPCPRGWKVPSDSVWIYALNKTSSYPLPKEACVNNYMDLGGIVSDAAHVMYPSTGYYENTSQTFPQQPGTYALWWTGQSTGYLAYALSTHYGNKYVTPHNSFTRGRAHNVRCELIGKLPDVPVSSVTVDPEEWTMEEGYTKQLTATIDPFDATDQNITWKSSNSNYVSVDQTGFITANKATGDTPVTITAKAGGKTGTCKVTVTEPTVKHLDANGTANSYIVPMSGMYTFDATVKGNGVKTASGGSSENSAITGASSAAILWQSFGTSSFYSNYETVIEDVSYKNGSISFSVPKPIKNGNAVIALYDKNKTILWSWHIWVVKEYDPDNSTKDRDAYYYYTKQKRSDILMDRNLGALSDQVNDPLSIGLLYQWGRKDPFPGLYSFTEAKTPQKTSATWPAPVNCTSINGNVDYTVRNPMLYIMRVSASVADWCYTARTDLWARSKTMYDPCPPGWKVPEGDEDGVWATAKWKNGTVAHDTYEVIFGTLGSYGMLFDADEMGNDAWYPCGGYIDESCGEILGSKGQKGYYWSSDPKLSGNLRKSFCLTLSTFGANATYYPVMSTSRGLGASVRCQMEY